MYCRECGVEVDASRDRFCYNCGTAIKSESATKAVEATWTPGESSTDEGLESSPISAPQRQASELTSKRELKGVGGWLKFYIIFFCIVAPILGFLVTLTAVLGLESNSDFSGFYNWETYRNAMYGIVVVNVFVMFRLAYILSTSELQTTKGDAIMMMWVAGPVALIGGGIVMHFALPEGRVFEEIIPAALGSAFWTTLWTLYFKKSKRVANTYWKPV